MNFIPPDANMDRAADARVSPRTNLFLGAVLRGIHFSAPVKVRNMSDTGALVEAAEVPPPSSRVQLVRGSLTVGGDVVWSAVGRCGLRFSTPVSVREWLSPPSNKEQARVDDEVRLLKAGAIPLQTGTGVTATVSHNDLGTDLRNVVRLVERLADDLASDEATVIAHAQGLQNLDIVVQTLDAIANMLAGDAAEQPALAKLENLRTSYREALGSQRAS